MNLLSLKIKTLGKDRKYRELISELFLKYHSIFPGPFKVISSQLCPIGRSEPDLIAIHIRQPDTWILEAIWSWPAAFKAFIFNFKRFIVVTWCISVPASIPIVLAYINNLFKIWASHTFAGTPVISVKSTSSTYWAVTEAFIRIWRSWRIDEVASSIFPNENGSTLL